MTPSEEFQKRVQNDAALIQEKLEAFSALSEKSQDIDPETHEAVLAIRANFDSYIERAATVNFDDNQAFSSLSASCNEIAAAFMAIRLSLLEKMQKSTDNEHPIYDELLEESLHTYHAIAMHNIDGYYAECRTRPFKVLHTHFSNIAQETQAMKTQVGATHSMVDQLAQTVDQNGKRTEELDMQLDAVALGNQANEAGLALANQRLDRANRVIKSVAQSLPPHLRPKGLG